MRRLDFSKSPVISELNALKLYIRIQNARKLYKCEYSFQSFSIFSKSQKIPKIKGFIVSGSLKKLSSTHFAHDVAANCQIGRAHV